MPRCRKAREGTRTGRRDKSENIANTNGYVAMTLPNARLTQFPV